MDTVTLNLGEAQVVCILRVILYRLLAPTLPFADSDVESRRKGRFADPAGVSPYAKKLIRVWIEEYPVKMF